LPVGWNINSVEWLECLRLVARKNGRERTLFSRGIFDDFQSYVRWLPARNGNEGGNYGGNGASTSISFALHKVPLEWGELWLCFDMGLRSALMGNVRSIDAATVARLKQQGGAVWASKSLLLRRDGEIIKLPVVSTNPQLEIDSWRVEPFTSASGEDRQLVMHLFDAGPLPQKQNLWFHTQTASDWQIVDEKGQTLSNHGGDPALVQKGKGARQHIAKFRFSSRLAPEARQLRLRGQLSCGKRWPLIINIPLLDRTRRPVKAKTESKS
jgi:hypothetical protein